MWKSFDVRGIKVSTLISERKFDRTNIGAFYICTGWTIGIYNNAAMSAICKVGKEFLQFGNRFMVDGNIVVLYHESMTRDDGNDS